MTDDEATSLAERAARDSGRELIDFEAPVITHDPDGWRFFYIMKSPAPPGGHFEVVVDERGGTRFIPGR